MLRFILPVYLFAFSPFVSPAQGLSPKQLGQRLQQARSDTDRVVILLGLASFYEKIAAKTGEKKDSALLYLRQADRLAASIPLAANRYAATGAIGRYYFANQDHEQGKKYFLQVIKELRGKGDKRAAIRWLEDLSELIPLKDSTPISKVACLRVVDTLYTELKDDKNRINNVIAIARVFCEQDKFGPADYEYAQLLAKDVPLQSEQLYDICFSLSVLNRYRGNYDRALFYAQKALKEIERNGETHRLEAFTGQLGFIYDEMGQPEKSAEYFKRTINLRKGKKQLPQSIYRTPGFLVRQLLKLKRYDEAHEVVLSLEKEHPPVTPIEKTLMAQVKGMYYEGVHQYAAAEKNYLDMLRFKGFSTANSEVAAKGYEDIGSFYFSRRRYPEAVNYLTRSLKLSPTLGTASYFRDVYQMIFKADSLMGNYAAAIDVLNAYQAFNDSIFSQAKKRQAEELKLQYETGKKELNLQLLERETKAQQDHFTQAKTTRNWIIVGCILLIVVTGLLVNYTQTKQKTNKALKAQQDEIREQNNSLAELASEKQWLLQEIHQRVKDNLQVVMDLLNTQSGYLQNKDALAAIQNSRHRVYSMSLIHEKLYNEGNLSSVEMRSYILELVGYLRHSFNTGDRIRFTFNLEPIVLDVSQVIPIGLILNESITNSIKYAFPGNREGEVSISLVQESGNAYLLTISDNGVGIPVNYDNRRKDSLGVGLMKGLSEDLDGEIRFENNNGTTLKLSFLRDACERNE